MPNKFRWEPPAQALSKWNPSLVFAKEDKRETINILGAVGDSFFEEGTTAKLVNAVLRKADGADVLVNINSPGGDFFEGLAIHSLLSGYDGNVTVNVLGLAASAASIVALAANEVYVAKSGFLMIHNAWTLAMGNSEDMREIAGMLEKFDESMVGLYADATGIEPEEIVSMMSAETWLSGTEAVEKGFAHALLNDDSVSVVKEDEKSYNSALKRVDLALAKAGMPRSERRAMIKSLTVTPCADLSTPCAGYADLGKSLSDLLATLKS